MTNKRKVILEETDSTLIEIDSKFQEMLELYNSLPNEFDQSKARKRCNRGEGTHQTGPVRELV